MTELQKKLLEMLKEIDEICKKHNITYYLIGGSALGAIRHHGFIPWDDDVDIVMTKSNMEKFEAIIDDEIRPDRKYMTWKREKEYPAIFGRYTNMNTTCIVNSLRYSPISWGLMIDIFTLIPIPNSEKERIKFNRIIEEYGEIVNPFFPVSLQSSSFKYFKNIKLSKIVGKKRVIERILKKINRFEESDCTHYSYVYPRVHIIYPKNIFQEPRYYPFEDMIVPVPTGVEEHLEILFGSSWMMLPEKKISDHGITVDIKRPFNLYLADYMVKTDTKKLMKTYEKWKLWRLRSLKKVRFFKDSDLKFSFIKDNLQLEKKISIKEDEIKGLFIEKKYNEINEILADSYITFTNKHYIKSKFKFSIDKELVLIVIFMLHRNGFFYEADELLKLYFSKNELENELYIQMENLGKAKKQIIKCFREKEYKTAQVLTENCLKKYNEDHTLLVFELKLLCDINKEVNKSVSMLINYAFKIFPKDSEYSKYYGDYLWNSGYKYAAIDQYKYALNKSQNGFIHLEIKEKFKESDIK